MEKKIEKRFRLGLALSGGGAKGFAHLGALQALEEKNLVPDIISGTSAGAFAGALYADGNKPYDIVKMFQNKAFSEFARFTIPQAGLFKTDRFESFLKKKLKAETFEDLKIPLLITATDIEEGTSVQFSSGELISAVIASCSVPIIFTPKEINGKYYVDGGIFKNFPVSILKPICCFTIGINASPLTKQKFKSSMLHVAERSFHYMSSSNSFYDKQLCDILIESKNLSEYTMFDLDHIEEIFQIGYEQTKKILESNLDMLEEIFGSVAIDNNNIVI